MRLLAGFATAAAWWASGLSRTWTPTSARPMTREGLAAAFESDIRNLVYRWNPEDDRPPTNGMRRYLRSSIKPTIRPPGFLNRCSTTTSSRRSSPGTSRRIVRDDVGLVLWPENKIIPAYGMAPMCGQTTPLSWTVNCLVCHTAEIDGVAYFGAGTKVFDDKWLGESLKTMTDERWRPLLARDAGSTGHRDQCPQDSVQPPSRQDRFADARALNRVCRIARGALHASPRRQDAGR